MDHGLFVCSEIVMPWPQHGILPRTQRRENRVDLIERGWMLGLTWWLVGIATLSCGVALMANDMAMNQRIFTAPMIGPTAMAIGLACCGIAVARGAQTRTIVINTAARRIIIHNYKFGRHVHVETMVFDDVDVIELELRLSRYRFAQKHVYRAIVLLTREQAVVLAVMDYDLKADDMRNDVQLLTGLRVRGTRIQLTAPGFNLL